MTGTLPHSVNNVISTRYTVLSRDSGQRFGETGEEICLLVTAAKAEQSRQNIRKKTQTSGSSHPERSVIGLYC